MKKYRLNLKKFIPFVLTIIMVVSVIVSVFGNNHKVEIVDYDRYYVTSGDTLWDIASSINPGIDNRRVVYDIAQMNEWNGAVMIAAGDVISIPVYSK